MGPTRLSPTTVANRFAAFTSNSPRPSLSTMRVQRSPSKAAQPKTSFWALVALAIFVFLAFFLHSVDPPSFELLEMDSSSSSNSSGEEGVPYEQTSSSASRDRSEVHHDSEERIISPTKEDSSQDTAKVEKEKEKPASTTTTTTSKATTTSEATTTTTSTTKKPSTTTSTTSTTTKKERAIKKYAKKLLPKKMVLKNPRDAVGKAGVPKVDLKLYFTNDRKRKVKRKPLKSLIKDQVEGIQDDVRHMMDFAILGHAKCATTFVNGWLKQHPEVQTFDEEVCDLYDLKPASLVKKLYEDLPSGDYQRGFKCPGHFSRRPMRYFRRYFSKTKLIVGIRHPVQWFESYYNFIARHGDPLPDPNHCIHECTPECRGVCTTHANFHASLAIFGKTNMMDPTERRLLRMHDKYQFISRIDNPVFLYHSDQLYDKNTTRFERVRSDFQQYMGLQQAMPNVTKYKSSRGIVKAKAIDICESRYAKVREELVKIGERADAWIRRYFLDSPQVFYSDRGYLEQLLRDFANDPCAAKEQSQQQASAVKQR